MTGEFDFIARHAPPGARRGDVLLGSGDDAALLRLPEGRVLAATVDTLVCGRHFPENTDAYDIGWKSLAVNLSDLAAMGAEAAWVTVALTLPPDMADKDGWMARFSAGIQALAEVHGVAVVGGDLTAGPLSITVQALGHVQHDQALRRDAARPGDVVAVSGTLGDAALALHLLQAGQAAPAELLERLNRPQPRLELGSMLAGKAHAAIDISDGLLADLGHILKDSGVGAVLHADDIPRSQAYRQLCPVAVSDQLALTGGDDYELCVCLPREAMIDGLTVIGRIETGSGCRVLDAQGQQLDIPHAGFDHFAERK